MSYRKLGGRTDWIVTIPKTTEWDDYQKELDSVKDGATVLNYKTRYIPKDMQIGDRMFITWNNDVKGWMEIVDFGPTSGFECETTGKEWSGGNYIQRSGEFHPVSGEIYNGFRGIRKYER